MSIAKSIHLGVAADVPRQPAPGTGLEPGPRRAGSRNFVDLDGFGEPFHRNQTQRLHLDVALYQCQRRGRGHDRAGIGKLFHTCGQISRLADGRVVHVEV